MLVNYHR